MGVRPKKLVLCNFLSVCVTVTLLLSSCSKEELGSALLEKDQIQLTEKLGSIKVLTYKLGKIMFRASADTSSKKNDLPLSKEDVDAFSTTMTELDNETPSALDYLKLYRQYKELRSFAKETDEDDYPTLSVAYATLYPDSTKEIPTYSAVDKLAQESVEHLLLSFFALGTPSMGTPIALYESNEVMADNIQDSEIRVLANMFKGFIFQQSDLLYLGEETLTKNISYIDDNPTMAFPLISHFVSLKSDEDSVQHTLVRGMNYLFRGITRRMMDRDVDKKRAIEDFEVFLADANKIGFDNELTWSIEAYVYADQGENEKAIESLQKLKISSSISASEKETIDKLITHLKTRKADGLLTGINDKMFVSKTVASYSTNQLSAIDWNALLKANNVSMADKMLASYKHFTGYIEGIQSNFSKEGIDESIENSKDKVDNIWNQAEKLLD